MGEACCKLSKRDLSFPQALEPGHAGAVVREGDSSIQFFDHDSRIAAIDNSRISNRKSKLHREARHRAKVSRAVPFNYQQFLEDLPHDDFSEVHGQDNPSNVSDANYELVEKERWPQENGDGPSVCDEGQESEVRSRRLSKWSPLSKHQKPTDRSLGSSQQVYQKGLEGQFPCKTEQLNLYPSKNSVDTSRNTVKIGKRGVSLASQTELHHSFRLDQEEVGGADSTVKYNFKPQRYSDISEQDDRDSEAGYQDSKDAFNFNSGRIIIKAPDCSHKSKRPTLTLFKKSLLDASTKNEETRVAPLSITNANKFVEKKGTLGNSSSSHVNDAYAGTGNFDKRGGKEENHLLDLELKNSVSELNGQLAKQPTGYFNNLSTMSPNHHARSQSNMHTFGYMGSRASSAVLTKLDQSQHGKIANSSFEASSRENIEKKRRVTLHVHEAREAPRIKQVGFSVGHLIPIEEAAEKGTVSNLSPSIVSFPAISKVHAQQTQGQLATMALNDSVVSPRVRNSIATRVILDLPFEYQSYSSFNDPLEELNERRSPRSDSNIADG